MYYSFFILYLIIGFSISLGFLFWAIKNGQFKDQQRAKFLPLLDVEDASPPTASVSRTSRYQIYLLYGLMAFVMMMSVSVLIYAFII